MTNKQNNLSLEEMLSLTKKIKNWGGTFNFLHGFNKDFSFNFKRKKSVYEIEIFHEGIILYKILSFVI